MKLHKIGLKADLPDLYELFYRKVSLTLCLLGGANLILGTVYTLDSQSGGGGGSNATPAIIPQC